MFQCGLCLRLNRATLLNKLNDGWNAGIKPELILWRGIESERVRETRKSKEIKGWCIIKGGDVKSQQKH